MFIPQIGFRALSPSQRGRRNDSRTAQLIWSGEVGSESLRDCKTFLSSPVLEVRSESEGL